MIFLATRSRGKIDWRSLINSWIIISTSSFISGLAPMDPKSPDEWKSYREIGHEVLDLIINNLQEIRSEPVW
jgi:hypothetical protein